MNYTVGNMVVARVVGCERRRNRRITYGANGDEEEYYYQLKLSLKTVVEEKKTEENEETIASDVVGMEVVALAAGLLLMPK